MLTEKNYKELSNYVEEALEYIEAELDKSVRYEMRSYLLNALEMAMEDEAQFHYILRSVDVRDDFDEDDDAEYEKWHPLKFAE